MPSITAAMKSGNPENVKSMLEKYYTNHFPVSIRLRGGTINGKQTTLSVLISRSGRLVYVDNNKLGTRQSNFNYGTTQNVIESPLSVSEKGPRMARALVDGLFKDSSGYLIVPFDFENGDIKSLETQIGALHKLTESVPTHADMATLVDRLQRIVDSSQMTPDIADVIKLSTDRMVLENLAQIFKTLERGPRHEWIGGKLKSQKELATLLTQIGRFTFGTEAADARNMKRALEGLHLFQFEDLGEVFKSVSHVFMPNFINPSGMNSLPADVSKMLEDMWNGVIHEEIRNLPHDKLLVYMDIYFESMVDAAIIYDNPEFNAIFRARMALKIVALFIVTLILGEFNLHIKTLATLLLLVSYADNFAPFAAVLVIHEVFRRLHRLARERIDHL